MTLTESLLPKLSEWTAGRRRAPLVVGRVSDRTAGASASPPTRPTRSRASCGSCSLTRTAEPPVGHTLKLWASAIADRVTGLMEPLSVYEVDETRNEAIVRSEAPGRKGQALAYYELRLSGLTGAALRRFTASKSEGGRTQIAFPVTHETLAKLIGDIAG